MFSSGFANLLFSDRSGDPVVSTVAGSGQLGFQDGPCLTSKWNYPSAIVVTSRGDLIVVDAHNHRIRKISSSTGQVATMAGTGQPGYADGNAAVATFKQPFGLAVDAADNIYVADTGNNRIRKITNTGVVTTVAGDGSGNFRDGPAAQAQFNAPAGVSCLPNDELAIVEMYCHRVRKITSDGNVLCIAGQVQPGYVDGPAAAAKLNAPKGVATDAFGNIYIADTNNNRIRKLTLAQQHANLQAMSERSLSAAMLTLLKDSSVADCTVMIGDTPIALHQSILRIRCPKLLLTEKQAELNSNRISIQSFNITLEFIYGDKLPLRDLPSLEALMGAILCAKILELRGFYEYCRNFFVVALSPNNVCEAVIFALENNLAADVLDFCKSSFMKHIAFFNSPQAKGAAMQKLKKVEGKFNLEVVLSNRSTAAFPPQVLQIEQMLSSRIVPLPQLSLGPDMRKLFDEVSGGGDISLIMGEQELGTNVVRAHKAILGCRWYYFQALAAQSPGDIAEGRIVLPLIGPSSPEMVDIATSAVAKLVEYFYSGLMSHIVDAYDCLYIAGCAAAFGLTAPSDGSARFADGMDHSQLIKHCVKAAVRAISSDTAIQILNAAYLLHVDEVFELAKQYVINHFTELADNPNLHNLPSPILSHIYSFLLKKIMTKLQL